MAAQDKAAASSGWGRAWKIVVGVGALLSLIGTAFGLWDRVANRTPKLSTDLSTTAGAREFVAFTVKHSGQTVTLDVSCNDDDAQRTSCLIEQGIGELPTLMWAFQNGRCFNDSNDFPNLNACRGGNAFWIAENQGTGAVVANGPTGAGSLIVRGKFTVQDQGFGGAVFPRNIRNFRITPIRA